MTPALRHSVALFTIALQMFSAAALEYAHHDGHATGSFHGPAYTSHDCGPNERHLPIEGKRVCAVCIYAFSLVATCVVSPATSGLPAARSSMEGLSARHTGHSSLYHSGKRGPPAA